MQTPLIIVEIQLTHFFIMGRMSDGHTLAHLKDNLESVLFVTLFLLHIVDLVLPNVVGYIDNNIVVN